MDEHAELNRTLGEILGELKGINRRLDTVNGRLNKHDDKIDTLEAFKETSTGKLTVIGSIAGFVFALVGSWVSGLIFK